MRLEQRLLKMLGALSVLALAVLTITACGSSASAASLNDGKLAICHATGNTATPYDEITLDFNGLSAHVDHSDDLIPAPAGGCPKAVETGTNLGKLSICHATGTTTNPYTEITIDFNGLRGHSNHTGDIIPAPKTGCPSVIPTSAITATVTATVTGTPSGTGTPVMTTTSGATAPGNNDGKITICHAIGSKRNSYVQITVSVNGLNGHDKHPRDIIPVPAGGCPN